MLLNKQTTKEGGNHTALHLVICVSHVEQFLDDVSKMVCHRFQEAKPQRSRVA